MPVYLPEPKELLTRCIEHPQEGLEELRENIRKLENTDLVKAFAFRILTYMQEKYEQESARWISSLLGKTCTYAG